MGRGGLGIEDTPQLLDVARLHPRLHEANVAATGVGDGRSPGIFVRDAAGEISAGREGWTWGGCLFSRTLWVREDLRRTGQGTRLMRAAEAGGIRRGCRRVMLDTDSFDAPGFYGKLGDEMIAEMEAIVTGSTRFVFRKWLPTPT
jgi:GNAT superfamily N-acetyltransferase